MKKRSLVLLSVICILSICAFTGLLIFAFDQQLREDKQTVSDDNSFIPTPVPKEPAKPTNPPTPTPTPAPTQTPPGPIVLSFAGDVNLDEDSYPVKIYDSEGKGILGVLSKDLVEEMNNSDIMMLNNEFAFSKRGVEEENKSYTFRAKPGRVSILKEMGTDIVSLANNHALDFGQDALIDTFSTLDTAGIDYVGAGEDMDRAKSPVYKKVGDKTIAFVAASRVVFDTNWYATDTTPGMVGTYDPAVITESIKEARENSDFVVVYVHWGVELKHYPEKYQRVLAENYIDAGADAVIGCHPHVMQGIEFYQGKPIAYSLGNFWFNKSNKESGMLKLYLDPDKTVRVQLLPVMNKAMKTYLLTDQKEIGDYYDFMQKLSFHIVIDEHGFVSEDVK